MAEAFYVLKVCNYESAAEKHLTMKACSDLAPVWIQLLWVVN